MNEENEKMFHDACLEWFADLKFDIQGFSTNENNLEYVIKTPCRTTPKNFVAIHKATYDEISEEIGTSILETLESIEPQDAKETNFLKKTVKNLKHMMNEDAYMNDCMAFFDRYGEDCECESWDAFVPLSNENVMCWTFTSPDDTEVKGEIAIKETTRKERLKTIVADVIARMREFDPAKRFDEKWENDREIFSNYTKAECMEHLLEDKEFFDAMADRMEKEIA